MLARIGGKVKRISVDEKIGSWTLKGIDDREVVFTKDGAERRLLLVVAKPAPPPKVVPGGPQNPQAGGPGGQATPSGTPEQRSEQLQKMIEQRQRTMRRR